MQNSSELLKRINHHIQQLSVNIGERPTGSTANHQAEHYIKQTFLDNQFQVKLQEFDCIDWEKNKTTLNIEGTEVHVEPSPYSLPCNVQADIDVVANISQLL